MSSMLGEEIADYLESRGLGGVHATDNTDDIFLERLPKGETTGLWVMSQPGSQPDMYVDTMEDGLTLYARHKDGTVAYKRLKDAMDILHRASNYDLPGSLYVYFSYATAGIAYVDTDLNAGMIYMLNMNFIYRDKNVIS